ncbi:hypothetical protein [Capnocytophaga canimorsus]|uniref:Uncharacterized protein n=1 Tax=Capnocytophaga canimorsus TaxID=28188 RepID=A0A250G4I7_9FLAO|nr:hypothetical protein [Capnocytophaga canimorsus]ATA92329.1 hypothetical protein CGC56_09280 [Capnocytophaga canimorsus]AWL79172.1 hypothetical protein DKB58_09605 [Capnocytophaga canimorsus]AYW37771.1 hypothetical protein D8L92_11090 [Capnocytophaga canimorsus]
MLTLNVSFGIFVFMPLGWLFMLIIILLETFFFSKKLKNQWFNLIVFWKILVTNIISGIIGILISLKLNGGWWLVVWFPWVSKNEVSLSNPQAIKWLAIYYLCAFILTLTLEFLTNYLFFKKSFDIKKIGKLTLLANVISYLFGSIVLYSYSFL